MIAIEIKHYESPFSDAAMQRITYEPDITIAVLETEPTDYAMLGDPVTDWSHHNETTKERQFVKRDRTARIDHLFQVTIRHHG